MIELLALTRITVADPAHFLALKVWPLDDTTLRIQIEQFDGAAATKHCRANKELMQAPDARTIKAHAEKLQTQIWLRAAEDFALEVGDALAGVSLRIPEAIQDDV